VSLDIPAVAGFLCGKHSLIRNGIKRYKTNTLYLLLMTVLQRTLSIPIYPPTYSIKWQYYKHVCPCAGQGPLRLISVDAEVKLAT